MFLGSRIMYSSRSVDSRGLFLRISNLGYPCKVPEVLCKYCESRSSKFLKSISGTLPGYPRLEVLRKRSRESTDLEQYIVVEPKNII